MINRIKILKKERRGRKKHIRTRKRDRKRRRGREGIRGERRGGVREIISKVKGAVLFERRVYFGDNFVCL